MYTSGTTGFPKGVMRDHSLLRSMLDRYARLAVTERDVIINYLPLFHIFGYVDGPLSTLIGGHRQVLTETFDADAALDLVEREGATLLHGFETHMKALVDAQEARPRNLSTLRTGILAVGMASADADRLSRAQGAGAAPTPDRLRHDGSRRRRISMSHLDSTDEQACETSGCRARASRCA